MKDDDQPSGRTRRGFLRLGAQATAAGALITAAAARKSRAAQLPAPTHVPVDESSFPLGVASGDAKPTSAILWTHYTGSAKLKLSVWTPSGQVIVDRPTQLKEGYAHVHVDGLPSGARVHFAFFVLDDAGNAVGRSPLGSLRVAPPLDSLEPLLIGATACTRNGWDLSVVETAGRRRDLDLFLHLGDTVYCDGSRTISEYRERWHENFSHPGYRALRSHNSVLATWDDHEVDNDWTPETHPADLIQTARRAFFEHHPIERLPGHENRIYRSRRWGKTLEVFVLDSRSGRRRERDVPEYLDRRQMDWLKDGLKKSEATFKLLMNTVPVSRFPNAFAPNREERWTSYPESREEILSFIDANRIGGVLWLSGDFHLASVGRVSPHGCGRRALEVLAGPGGQFPNLRAAWLRGKQWDWASAENNYATFALDPRRGEVTVRHHNKRDETIQASVHKIA
jgi:alkaline phosphatase D